MTTSRSLQPPNDERVVMRGKSNERIGTGEVSVEEPQDSKVKRELASLKKASIRAFRTRERLPQPLFWSLFNLKISQLKKLKGVRRLVSLLD